MSLILIYSYKSNSPLKQLKIKVRRGEDIIKLMNILDSNPNNIKTLELDWNQSRGLESVVQLLIEYRLRHHINIIFKKFLWGLSFEDEYNLTLSPKYL